MEDTSFLSMISSSSSSSVPSFAQGLKILLVHDDAFSIFNLSSMLEKYSFRVTVTDEAQAAMAMICTEAEESQFNLVMAKDNMPDMDTLSFLHFMIQNHIPVIFISSGEYNDVTWKALAKGSCFFLEEPILLEDLKYVWQHVYHTKVNFLAQKTHKETSLSKVDGTLDTRKCLGKDKRKRLEMNIDRNNLNASMEEEDDTAAEREQNHEEFNEKRPRIVWTPELHQKFLDAINFLSERNNVRPKAILEHMNVPNLSARQISSHLQKYRTQELINQQACFSGFPPMATFPNLDGRSQSSSPYQNQGYPGFPMPFPALSGSQNQNQCPVMFTGTQESYVPQMGEAGDEFANYGRQNNLKAEVMGQPITNASMDQIQKQGMMREHDALRMLEEDGDEEHENSHNGVLSEQLDEYCEMLRNTLLRNDSPHHHPQYHDM